MNRDEHLLALACGDPRKTPATFTRFVFPFAYHLTSVSGTSDGPSMVGLHFRETEPCLERKKYFTVETSRVLYERTKWFQINEESAGNHPEGDTSICWNDTRWAKGVSLHRGDRKILTCMLPPQLVLFEWDRYRHNDGEKSIFSTGFLCLDLYFPDASKSTSLPILDDLLFINDMFRYFDCPYPSHVDQFTSAMREVPLSYQPPYQRVADLSKCDLEKSYFDRWARLLKFPVRTERDGQWYHLIQDPHKAIEQAWIFLSGRSTDPGFLVYADNRTYVWSSAVLKKGVNGLQALTRTNSTRSHRFGHWIKLLNVDPPDKNRPSKTDFASHFERKWAQERTYHRWEDSGTWYGFTYHSGVQLTSETIPENGRQQNNPYIGHFADMYFDMAILLFYLRMTLFRFSGLLSRITATKKEPRDGNWTKNFETLRELFSEFSILYQYPLLSNQQQGIEMYSLAREQFDVKDFYEEVKSEIDSTHEFIEMINTRELAERADVITFIGLPLAVIGVIAGLVSLSTADLNLCKCLQSGFSCPLNWEFVLLVFMTIVSGIVSFFLLRKHWKKLSRWIRKIASKNDE